MFDAIPTVTTYILSRVASTTANRYSFQATRNEKIAVATTPGNESGKTTRRKAPSEEHPSMTAASSSSVGIPSKNPFIIQTQNGNEKDVYARMSTGYVFSIWARLAIVKY